MPSDEIIEKVMKILEQGLPMTIKEHWDRYKDEYLPKPEPKQMTQVTKQAYYMGVFSMFGMVNTLAAMQREGKIGNANDKWAEFKAEIDEFLEKEPCIRLKTRMQVLEEYMEGLTEMEEPDPPIKPEEEPVSPFDKEREKRCLRCGHIHIKKCGCGCEDALL